MRLARFFVCTFLVWAASPAAATASTPSSLTVEIRNAAGVSLAFQSDPQKVALICNGAYQPGDTIVVSAPPQDKFLIIEVDDKVPESMVYSPTGRVSFPIPFGKLTEGYDPQAFTGTSHQIKARLASVAEITAYRNVALNSIDQRNVSQYFPHATASSVTRDDPQFFERNAIDGNTRNTHHGKWPYESWGNGLNSNPWLKIDFGRDVTVDKVRLYIRSDFPHDTYWTSLTIQFSDGSSRDITLRKTSDPQDFTFPEKTIRWIQLTNFKQPTLPLGFAAVTEMEVYGKDVARAQDAGTSFLLKPESAWLGTTQNAEEGATLAPRVDGGGLSFAAPQILIYKNTDQAEFISAVWKDASGQPSHQRDVFFVKPDYAVVVDYVFAKGRHSIVRSFPFPSGNLISDKSGAQSTLAGGKSFRVQAIDVAGATTIPSPSGKAVDFSSTVTTPAPVATVLLGWTGTAAPKIESVKPANPMVVKFNMTFPDGRADEIALAWEARPLHLSGREFEGWAACSRRSPAGTSSIEIN